MNSIFSRVYCFFLTLLFFVVSTPAHTLSLIRDTEIETTLRTLAKPILEETGLTPENVAIYIVRDDDVNAYVAGGMNMFFHTGLLTLSEQPDIVAGVIAHEAGHIAGGHLVRLNQEYSDAMLTTAVSSILGISAAAAGAGDVGMAIITGGQHVAERNLLKHSRQNEQSADQRALLTLDALRYSSRGLLDLMKYLQRETAIRYGKLNPYVLTHPLHKDRITHIKHHIEQSPYSDSPFPKSLSRDFRFSVVKLKAFLQPAEDTLAEYPASDTRDLASYARAIAYYKQPNLEKSLTEMHRLLQHEPDNPYYQELKGQILFEHGKILRSIPFYRRANELQPDEPLILIQLARSLMATEDRLLLQGAIRHFEHALSLDKRNSFAWHQLGIAYGRNGDIGLSNLALAEEAILLGKKGQARKFIERAKKTIEVGSPAMLRADDLLVVVEKE